MTEPQYEYVKGEGWVLSRVQRMEFELGLFWVVLEKRQPKHGEYYFSEPPGRTLEMSAARLKNGTWSNWFNQPNPLFPVFKADMLLFDNPVTMTLRTR